MTLLQPYGNRYPSTEIEFNGMTAMLRRIGHIIEHAPNNIASALRNPPGTMAGFAGMAADGGGGEAPAQDPWHTEGLDPWAAAAASSSPQAAAPAYPAAAAPAAGEVPPPPEPYVDSGTDTDTSSDHSFNIDYSDQRFANLSPGQIDAKIYWEYGTAKRQWRRHMGRPTRKVRKFLKKNTGHRLLRGKGKGRGRGAQRYAFLAELSQDQVDEVFFGGRGKGKGKRSSAKARAVGPTPGATTARS